MGRGAARALFGAGICAAGVVLLYGLAFHAGPGLRADDRVLESFLSLQTATVEHRAGLVTEFLNTLPFVIASAIVLAAALATGGLRTAVAAAAIFAGANGTTQVLQRWSEMPREHPWLPDTLWPSGHACAATTLAICVVLATPARLRPATVLLGTLGVLAVALSVLLIGSHRLSDVLAGILVAAVWAGGVGAALTRVAPMPGGGTPAAALAAAAAVLAALAVTAGLVAEISPARRYWPPIGAGALAVLVVGAVVVAATARLPAPVPSRLLTRTPSR